MLRSLAITVVLTALASPAVAATVTCQNLNIPVQGAADDAVITLTIGPEDILKQCTSSANLKLAIVTPEDGAQVSPAPGESLTIPFIVEDIDGNIGEAVITVARTGQPAE